VVKIGSRCCKIHSLGLPINVVLHYTNLHILQISIIPLRDVVGADWLSKHNDLVTAPCSEDTCLSCMWLQLQCSGGQVT